MAGRYIRQGYIQEHYFANLWTSEKNAIVQILDEFEARLHNITMVNGYNFDIIQIKRQTMEPLNGDDLPGLNFWISDDNIISTEYETENHQFSIFVEVYTRTADEYFQDLATKLAANIILGVNRDVSFPKVYDDQSICLGGLVDELTAQNTGFIIVDEERTDWTGALINFLVKYRINNGNNFEITR